MRSWPTASVRRSGASRMRRCLLAGLAFAGAAQAQDFQLHGYADARFVAAPDDASWTQGGLGKTRYGGGDALHFGGGALSARW